MDAKTTLQKLLGTLDWQPPPWWRPVAGRVDRGVAWAAANRARAATGGLLLLLVGALALGGAWWWRTRPQPVYVTVTVEAPAARDLNDPESSPAPLRLRFGDPAAPLAAIGAEAGPGLRLSPAVAGRWRWEDETTLAFEPTGDWPVGQRYAVQRPPQHEADRRAVPQPAENHGDEQVEIGAQAPLAVAAQRNVEIVAEPE